MDKFEFTVKDGMEMDRDGLILCLNVGTEDAPDWAPLGCGTEESAAEYDWQMETSRDILNHTHVKAKKPIKTQTFDPLPLTKGERATEWLWEKAVVEENVQALINLDLLEVHRYVKWKGTEKMLGIRHKKSSIFNSSFGGAGGASLDMPVEATYGGFRELGQVTIEAGAFTYTGGAPKA